jgi:hypothetical protein
VPGVTPSHTDLFSTEACPEEQRLHPNLAKLFRLACHDNQRSSRRCLQKDESRSSHPRRGDRHAEIPSGTTKSPVQGTKRHSIGY